MNSLEIALVFFLLVGALGKTVRYRIITDEDGNRELLPTNNSTASIPDISFLEKDLNISQSTENPETTTDAHVDTITTQKIASSNEPISDKHYKLMRKWNTFTADGWTRQKSDVYANSTKLVIYDDGSKNDSVVEVKQGRSENFTTDVQDEGLNPMVIWDVLSRLYECFQPTPEHNGTFDCIQTRITNMFMTFLGKSEDTDERNYPQEKTLIHGKKLLKGALLPLLVLLIIKYLIALPVLAAGIVTIKTFWLSLLSAGVAAFGAPWKKHVLKRHEPEIYWTQPPPWLGMDKNMKSNEKYYM